MPPDSRASSRGWSDISGGRSAPRRCSPPSRSSTPSARSGRRGETAARSRAWQNVLRAAYPDRKVPFARITAAYLVGAGMNSVVPARIGDAVKIFLAKRSIRRSTYPTVVSSFFVGSIFDTSAGIVVFVYALTQGLLPKPPALPDLPAFDIAFWAQHPSFLVFTLTALAIAALVIFALLARRVEAFWDRVKQGAIVLATPALY